MQVELEHPCSCVRKIYQEMWLGPAKPETMCKKWKPSYHFLILYVICFKKVAFQFKYIFYQSIAFTS
jgi:hypothetical protein